MVCALALAGCGGGGGGDSSATPAAQAAPAAPAQNNAVQPLKAAAPKIADVGITPTSALRPGTKVNFIVSGTFPSATTYVWDFGDSSPLSNGVSATHTYSKLGTFTVKVTATDTSNQKSVETRSVEIVQNQPPIVSGAVSIGRTGSSGAFSIPQGSSGVVAIGTGSSGSVNIGQTGAIGQTVNVVVNATDPQGDSLTYKWIIDGVAYGGTTASNTLSYSFATGGSHLLTVIVMDEHGGQTSRDFPVTVNSRTILPDTISQANPVPSFTRWEASYSAQPVGRIRVAADGTAWALPTKESQVLRSRDNGRSWQELTLPKDDDINNPLNKGFGDIGFADVKNIWVVGCPQQKYVKVEDGGRIEFDYAAAMHSSDGGGSWENFRINGFPEARCLRAIQFVGQNGWIVNELGIVVNTTNGGKTWQFQADTGIKALRMQFIDARNGWIIGAYKTGSKMQIARTTDGGATWTTSQPQGAEVNSFASLSFVDAKTGYASGSTLNTSSNPVLRTIDGGLTWTALVVPTGYITDILFTTPASGYALSMFGDVYSTKDGGLNWEVIGMADYEANVGLVSFARGDNSVLMGASSSAARGNNTALLGAPSTGGGVLWLAPL